tara:strand:+ start:3011 stop:5185 length:2175 start_codon:yes stop_codon:yes gene_type:complete
MTRLTMNMKEYYSASELAAMALPGLPKTERAIQIKAKQQRWAEKRNLAGIDLAKKRSSKGGGLEYHYSLLPSSAQAELVKTARQQNEVKSPLKEHKKLLSKQAIWQNYEALTEKKKQTAKDRLDVLLSVLALEKGGVAKNVAVAMVASNIKPSSRTIYNWFNMVEGYAREDWLATLTPHHSGRKKTAECDPEAWEFIKADYLRPERPTFQSCYERLSLASVEQGWSIPGARTLQRRMDKEIPDAVANLARFGRESWKQAYPAQERDRSVFHALEAVNADGHKWDVFVQWPDGSIGRPMMVAFQDLYSGKFLSWRIDQTENKEAVRLAFGDMVEEYGIPEHCYLDNGRGFANKWLTGGIDNRFRFKITDEDPDGIMKQLDVGVHWTLPHSGQSKPIERAFRDMCDHIAKDPRFAGAWTGNHIGNKPENYGKKAIPIEQFIPVIEEGILNHNARVGRKAKTCNGRSFDVTFEESYKAAPIRKATEEQKRLWLLAAEGVRASKRDGTLTMLQNRFWADFLLDHTGQKLVVRFDPQNMHKGLHVYRLDGGYLGFAQIWEAAGFNDIEAAQKHNRNRKKLRNAHKQQLEAERSMGVEDLAAYLPVPVNDTTPLHSKVVKPIFNEGPTDRKLIDALAAIRENTPKPNALSTAQNERIKEFRNGNSSENIVSLPESPKQRFERAWKLEKQIDADAQVDQGDALWLGQYQATPEYRSQRQMFENFGESYLKN